MTWLDVARRDLRSTYRSRAAPTVALLLVLSTFGVVSVLAVVSRRPPANEASVVVVGSVLSFVVPVVALVGTYGALVGERTTGSIRFLVGLPNSRTDAFVGKFVSRSLVVLVPLFVGSSLAGIVVAVLFEGGSFLDTLSLGLVGVPYAIAFVGLGLTFSAVADTETWAVGAAVGAFALFRAGWPAIQFALVSRLENPYPLPDWYFLLGRLDPINAYVRLTTPLANVAFHPLLTRPGPTVSTVATSTAFAAVVVLGWALLSPVVGFVYWRYRDLR